MKKWRPRTALMDCSGYIIPVGYLTVDPSTIDDRIPRSKSEPRTAEQMESFAPEEQLIVSKF